MSRLCTFCAESGHNFKTCKQRSEVQKKLLKHAAMMTQKTCDFVNKSGLSQFSIYVRQALQFECDYECYLRRDTNKTLEKGYKITFFIFEPVFEKIAHFVLDRDFDIRFRTETFGVKDKYGDNLTEKKAVSCFNREELYPVGGITYNSNDVAEIVRSNYKKWHCFIEDKLHRDVSESRKRNRYSASSFVFCGEEIFAKKEERIERYFKDLYQMFDLA